MTRKPARPHNPKIDGPLPNTVAVYATDVFFGDVMRGSGVATAYRNGLALASYPAGLNRGLIPTIDEVIAGCRWH